MEKNLKEYEDRDEIILTQYGQCDVHGNWFSYTIIGRTLIYAGMMSVNAVQN